MTSRKLDAKADWEAYLPTADDEDIEIPCLLSDDETDDEEDEQQDRSGDLFADPEEAKVEVQQRAVKRAGRPKRISEWVLSQMVIKAFDRDMSGRSYQQARMMSEFKQDLYQTMQLHAASQGGNQLATIKPVSASVVRATFDLVCPEKSAATHRNHSRSVALTDPRNAICFAAMSKAATEGIHPDLVGNYDEMGALLNPMGGKPTIVRLTEGAKAKLRERNISAGVQNDQGKQRTVHIGTQIYPDGLDCAIAFIKDHNFEPKDKVQRYMVVERLTYSFTLLLI